MRLVTDEPGGCRLYATKAETERMLSEGLDWIPSEIVDHLREHGHWGQGPDATWPWASTIFGIPVYIREENEPLEPQSTQFATGERPV